MPSLQEYTTWVGEKEPVQVLFHNSAPHYAVALNFDRNTTSIALNSNLHNLASMLQCNVFWKPFHIWFLLTEITSFLNLFSTLFISHCQ